MPLRQQIIILSTIFVGFIGFILWYIIQRIKHTLGLISISTIEDDCVQPPCSQQFTAGTWATTIRYIPLIYVNLSSTVLWLVNVGDICPFNPQVYDLVV